MTRKTKDEKTTNSKQEEQEISPEEMELLDLSKEVPHPGTVRVTIFPNTREAGLR